MKSIVKITLVATLITFTGYNIYNSQKGEEMSSATLANIEALAKDNESNPCETSECCRPYGEGCYYKSTMGDGRVQIDHVDNYYALVGG